MSWGPSHLPAPDSGRGLRRWAVGILVFLAINGLGGASRGAMGLVELIALGLVVWRIARAIRSSRRRRGSVATSRPAGVYLGRDRRGLPRYSRSEHAVLVIGPPRSGKTSSVIVPTVLGHDGPVVSTSTKPDVLRATSAIRTSRGAVWQFDPTGAAATADEVRSLRWSPLSVCRDWDGALLMARAMVDGADVGAGTTDSTHWAKRAHALLAATMHAAAVSGDGMRDVVSWVTGHELAVAWERLDSGIGSPMAAQALAGVLNTEARERSAILSAAADALEAYTSAAALDATEDPNFDAQAFVASGDTIYIHAPAESQRMAAALVCGLLAEIRRATYRAHAAGQLPRTVLLALDEVANVAPIRELPQIASEGGGQGVRLLAAVQDLSQARARWGTAADGFLTLFGTKLIFGGVADARTLENVSVVLGEYDRRVVSTTRGRQPRTWGAQQSYTFSTHRQRVLSPGDVAGIPAGRALVLDGVRWELVRLTPVWGGGSAA